MKESIKTYFKRHKITLIGVLVGSLGGYLYWHFIGCASGVCPITGNPYISTLYGALIGGLIFSTIKKEPKK
jgi:hypothetical protein